MEYFRIESISLPVSRICMGGSSPIGDLFKNSDSVGTFQAALEHAYAMGINFFDSAEAYGGGESEKILGKVISPIREHIVLASKAAWEHARAKDLRNACEASLKRLNTDYLDLYYLHYPNREVPIGETMETLIKLKDEGKIRAIGVSNFSLEQLQEAVTYGQVDVVQQCYSLLWRSFAENNLFPYCMTKGIKVVGYGPLASGLLSGKFSHTSGFDPADQRARKSPDDGLLLYLDPWWDRSLEVVSNLSRIAQRYPATLAQVAIKWTLLQEAVDAVIIGGKDKKQVTENARSMQVSLKPEDLSAMDSISRTFAASLPAYVNYYLKMRHAYAPAGA